MTPATKRSPSCWRSQSRCLIVAEPGAAVALTSMATTQPAPNSAIRSILPALLRSQVVETRATFGDDTLCPEVQADEGLEQAPEKVPIAQYGVRIRSRGAYEQPRIDQMTLLPVSQALEPIGRPCRQSLDDQEIRQQAFMGGSRPPIDPCCLEERALVHDASGVERVGLEVATQTARIPTTRERRGIAREELLHVALEPATPPRATAGRGAGAGRWR